jgi:hypothetical protein
MALTQAPLAVGSAALVGGLGAAQGGYFPSSWGWASLALLWAASLVLLLRPRLSITRLQAAYVAALAALAAWIGLTIWWSRDPAGSVNELERAVVYLAAGLAAIVIVRRADIGRLLGGAFAAIALVSLYALATRLFPDRVGNFDPVAIYRLASPLGYWNALGLFAVMGLMLGVGFASQAGLLARIGAGAALPILATTLYFTFGRGAWLAFFVAVAALLLVSPARVRLVAFMLVLLPAPVLAVWLASRSSALTARHPVWRAAVHDGHRLAPWILLLVLLSAGTAAGLALVERKVAVPRRVRLGFAGVVAAVALGGLVAVFVTYGSPVHIVRSAYHQFESPPKYDGSLTSRLFMLSSNGRVDLWHAAWRNYQDHPWLGSGAGTFEEYWARHRPYQEDVRDAHGLYAETLSEVGPIGLALLAVFLAIPFAGLRRARHHPLVPAAAAAYVAYVVHAIFDWDWEMPVLGVTAILCAAAILASRGPRDDSAEPVARKTTYALAALLLVPIGFSLVALVGNTSMGSAAGAIRSGDWSAAAGDARRARFWAPWSPRPWQLLAVAELGLGHRATAVRDLQRAIAKSPRDWQLWFQLSSYAKGDLREQARARVRELNPIEGESLPRRS